MYFREKNTHFCFKITMICFLLDLESSQEGSFHSDDLLIEFLQVVHIWVKIVNYMFIATRVAFIHWYLRKLLHYVYLFIHWYPWSIIHITRLHPAEIRAFSGFEAFFTTPKALCFIYIHILYKECGSFIRSSDFFFYISDVWSCVMLKRSPCE